MGADQHINWHRAAASTLAWWDAAGVDTLVENAPRNWLAPVARAAVVAPAPTADGFPDDVAAFLPWRCSDAAPEAAWAGAWIAATGPIEAPLMVLADCPDVEAEGGLLSDEAGRLFGRMLAAIGLAREGVHLASVCAKRPVAGRVPQAQLARLHELTLAHIRLVAPPTLLLFGNGASRAVLGADVASARGRLHLLNHKSGQTKAVASFHPRFLLERPAAKAGSWADLQLLAEHLPGKLPC